ncbi:MAG TPA: MarR family winged helix-turn-helix transcriptional regulator [Ktedonosporobacter sp.]|nr:MarR family winged helix-turn-helix transcriptional regulator [Ktedonosporobacter sp.]
MLHPSVLARMRLYRVSQKIDRVLNGQLRSSGLNMAQFDVLAHVGAARGITQQGLADRLLVTKGNISQLLDRMEKLDLLRRCQDGRNNTLALTEKGQALYDRTVPVHEQLIEEQLSILSTQEVRDLLQLLRKLDHALD